MAKSIAAKEDMETTTYIVTFGGERGNRGSYATLAEAESAARVLAAEGQRLVDESGTRYPWTVRMSVREASTRRIVSDWTSADA